MDLLTALLVSAFASVAIARLTTRERGPFAILEKWQKFVESKSESTNQLVREWSHLSGCMYCLTPWAALICFTLVHVPYVQIGVEILAVVGVAWTAYGMMGAYAPSLRE